MLLNWLKKDIAKDLALVKGIGAGLKGRRTSVDKPAVAAVSVGLLAGALSILSLILTPAKRDSDNFINGQGWPDPIKLGSLDIDPFSTGYWSADEDA